MARKNILSTDTTAATARTAAQRPQPRGAVGALQSSLSKLQESAVQDIDPDLIDDAGYEDRLGHDSAAHAELRDSLQNYGQQVPVLLRPHPKKPRRYEIVYGRRRLRALKELGQPVKAMVRQMSDQDLVMAQGQENTARTDLSFVERAAFAAQLLDAGYERQTIADALSVDLPMVSRMLKVGCAFDMDFFRAVGPAPGIGRDRWMQLIKVCEDKAARGRAMKIVNRPGFVGQPSDARFEATLAFAMDKAAARSPAPPKPRTLRAPDGSALGDIKQSRKAVTLTVPGAFGAWLNDQADDLLTELHDRWQKERPEDPET